MRYITIITGASSGIGAEFARQLAPDASGTELWLIARRAERLSQIKAELEALPFPPLIRTFALDIAGRGGVESFSALLGEEAARGEFLVRTLINNAGRGTYGVFEKTPLHKELDLIDLNVTALTGICGLCLPYMREGALVINTASMAGFWPLGNFAVYGASKAYVLSFSIALAAELKNRGIHVLALCPGPVDTEFAAVASNGARQHVRHGVSARKVVRHCLRKARRGRHIAVLTLGWKLEALASRLFGRYAGARLTYRFCKRPNADIDSPQ